LYDDGPVANLCQLVTIFFVNFRKFGTAGKVGSATVNPRQLIVAVLYSLYVVCFEAFVTLRHIDWFMGLDASRHKARLFS
jgi:hypothetical protein